MDRVQLKLTGKRNLKKSYGDSIFGCLLSTAVTFVMMLILAIWVLIDMFFPKYYSFPKSVAPTGMDVVILSLFLNVLISLVVILIVRALLFCILNVMLSRFFLMNRKQSYCNILATIFSFKGAEYFKVLGGMILKNIYLSLWSLLFVIPGIIKSFSYFMVPYILAENPNIGANRAITISRKTMQGSKLDLFVFYLSFIGWRLLSVLTLGIFGICYVNPYYQATKAEFYISMKQKARKMNIYDETELV